MKAPAKNGGTTNPLQLQMQRASAEQLNEDQVTESCTACYKLEQKPKIGGV